MSDAADKLARSRRAIIEQIQHREPRSEHGDSAKGRELKRFAGEEEPRTGGRPGSGWFARFRYAARTWWRHHPAHLGLELATPALSTYAEKKPLQFLGIAAAVGAVVVIIRPWRLISVTGLLLGIAKSSQLSGVLLSALSAADFPNDQERPYE